MIINFIEKTAKKKKKTDLENRQNSKSLYLSSDLNELVLKLKVLI